MDIQYNTQSIGMKVSYVQFDAGTGYKKIFEEVNILRLTLYLTFQKFEFQDHLIRNQLKM